MTTRTSTFGPPEDAAGHGTATTASPPRTRRVVDAPVRMFHALFALSFLGAYLTAESERWRALHVTLGYTLAGLLAFRVVYGLIGPRPAGLALLWRKLGGARAWWGSMRAGLAERRLGTLPWRQGQNLLMALAVFSLIVLALPLTLSGIAGYNEWGGSRAGDALEELHEFFGNAMLAVVLVHVSLVALLSVLRRRNMALPMLTGRVVGAGPDLVPRPRAGLAALVLGAVLAFGAWQWQSTPQGLLPGAGAEQPTDIKASSGKQARPGRPARRGHDDDD